MQSLPHQTAPPHRVAAALQRGKTMQTLALDIGADADGAHLLDEVLRERGLARSRQTVGDDERGMTMVQTALHQRQVLAARCHFHEASMTADIRLCGANGADLGAHGRAIGEIKTQYGNPRIVAARFKTGVEPTPGIICPPVMQQVHHHERQLVHHVDPAQRGIEFDAVERHRRIVDARDVAQMQIAVAFAHEALHAPRREQGGAGGELRFAGARQCGETGGIRRVLQQGPHLGKILAHERLNGCGCAI